MKQCDVCNEGEIISKGSIVNDRVQCKCNKCKSVFLYKIIDDEMDFNLYDDEY